MDLDVTRIARMNVDSSLDDMEESTTTEQLKVARDNAKEALKSLKDALESVIKDKNDNPRTTI